MTFNVPERRRSQRISVGPRSWLSVPSSWPVHLLDLSMGGLSFSSQYRLDVGRTASVQATLGREAFHGRIRVCWSRPRGAGHGGRPPFEIGAVFLPLDETSRQALESFLKLSPAE
jgi:hypothetical protein